MLQQQEELIEDEQEQEQKEEDARRAKREADELEARLAQSLLPDSEVGSLKYLYTYGKLIVPVQAAPRSRGGERPYDHGTAKGTF